MFVWNTATILGEIAEHMPVLSSSLTELQAAFDTRREKAVQARLWQRLRVEQIDVGVMERTYLGAVVAVDNMGWNDVGDWNSLTEVCPKDEQGNVVVGEFEGIDTSGCVVVGSGRRLIATVGLKDIVIVETDDAILVCPRQQAQTVRKIVEKLRADKREKYL